MDSEFRFASWIAAHLGMCRRELGNFSPKVNLFTYSLRYYILKKAALQLANIISSIARETEFCQICDCWWNINSDTSFHFRLFHWKLMTKFLKRSKKLYFWVIWGNFCPNFGENEFLAKGLSQFFNIIIIYDGANNLKKLTTNSW